MMTACHTYEETAAQLGLSVDKVRAIEQRALRKLRRNQELQKLAKDERETICDRSPFYSLSSSWPSADALV